MKIEFPDPADVLNFNLTINPDEGKLNFGRLDANITGQYKGGSFKFTVAINPNYPHEPPKVRCVPKVS